MTSIFCAVAILGAFFGFIVLIAESVTSAILWLEDFFWNSIQ